MNKILEAHERSDYAKPLSGRPATVSRNANLPANTGITDPYLAFAAQESGQDILGDMVRFVKGDYLVGTNKEEMRAGVDFMAAVDAIVLGFVRWLGKQQVERCLGRLSDGFREPEREELGHLDE